MLNTEQLAGSNDANCVSPQSIVLKAFEGFERYTTLNLKVVKTGLSEVSALGFEALSAKVFQSLFTLQSGLLQHAAERASAYGRVVLDIVATRKADVQRVALIQAAEVQKSFFAAIGDAMKHLPDGSGNCVALFNSIRRLRR